MIFRCEYVAQHKRGKGVPPSSGKTLPVEAAEAWRGLPAEEKEKYALLAEKEKVEHARRHPGYQYHPKKKAQSGNSTQPVSSHGGPVRASHRVSKRGESNHPGAGAREKGQAPEHCPEGIFTRRRSTSMPIRTESCGFLQPHSPSGRWMRRAMSVETTPSAEGMSSSVDGPFDPVNTATSPMEIPPSKPSSPLMQVRESDVLPQLSAPPLSTTSSLADWNRLPSSSPQTDLVMRSVLPWQSQPPNGTCQQETWDDPSSYTHSYEPRTTPLHAEYTSTEPAVYPWSYHSSQSEHAFDARWKVCNEAEEATHSYALQNFDYGMAQQSLTNGEDLAFDMSTADEGKFLEDYLSF
ncbi:slightly ste11-like protein [Marasmius tenuissimus]|uniref:Slightly ste11-like protein n=1 Tax=Marasmius tenuissimus TaxID=585030 RepID=A0ABR3A4J8_9AGAR